MSHKAKHPHNNPPSDPNKKSRQQDQTKRHVYVEPGVQIDFVEDFRKKYETAQDESTTHNKKQLFWTKVSAALLLIYVGLTLWQAWSSHGSLEAIKKQFRLDQRPYISITKYEVMDPVSHHRKEPQTFEIGKEIEVNVDFRNVGKTIAVNMIPHYHLVFGQNGLSRIKVEPEDVGEQGDTVDPGAEGAMTAVSLADTFSREDAFIKPTDVVIPWDGSTPVVIFGRISYRDTAGEHYCNPILVQYVEGGNWGRLTRIAGVSASDFCPKPTR